MNEVNEEFLGRVLDHIAHIELGIDTIEAQHKEIVTLTDARIAALERQVKELRAAGDSLARHADEFVEWLDDLPAPLSTDTAALAFIGELDYFQFTWKQAKEASDGLAT